MEGGNKLLRIAQISEQIEWSILNQVQVLPYSELHRQEITMIESYGHEHEACCSKEIVRKMLE